MRTKNFGVQISLEHGPVSQQRHTQERTVWIPEYLNISMHATLLAG